MLHWVGISGVATSNLSITWLWNQARKCCQTLENYTDSVGSANIMYSKGVENVELHSIGRASVTRYISCDISHFWLPNAEFFRLDIYPKRLSHIL